MMTKVVIMFWFVSILPIFTVEEAVRFISPEDVQNLRIEVKFYTENEQGIEELNLTILPDQGTSDTSAFRGCLRGPNIGCVYETNTLPACWIKASNGEWIEQLFCTDYSRFEQFNAYLGLAPEDPVPDFGIWTCRGLSPAQFASCQKFDYDADNDVDLADFGSYQRQYGKQLFQEGQKLELAA